MRKKTYFIDRKTAPENIRFLYAFSGCDSTSAIFDKGKGKFITTFTKDSTPNKPLNL